MRWLCLVRYNFMIVPVLTIVQIEQLSLTARLSRECADYVAKKIHSADEEERAGYQAHIDTLIDILAQLTGEKVAT